MKQIPNAFVMVGFCLVWSKHQVLFFKDVVNVQAIDPHVVTLSFFDFEGHGIQRSWDFKSRRCTYSDAPTKIHRRVSLAVHAFLHAQTVAKLPPPFFPVGDSKLVHTRLPVFLKCCDMGGGAISIEDDFDTNLQPMNITFRMKTIWIQATKIPSGELY